MHFLGYWLLTNGPMELSSSWKSDSPSTDQEVALPLWSPNVHHSAYTSPPLGSILSLLNPIHSVTPYFFNIHYNIVVLSKPGSPIPLFDYYETLYTFLIYPRAPPMSSPYHFFTLILHGEQHKLWSSSLRNFLRRTVTSSLLGPTILFSTPWVNALIYVVSFGWESKFHFHIKQQIKL
jgi:hypothetical protein